MDSTELNPAVAGTGLGSLAGNVARQPIARSLEEVVTRDGSAAIDMDILPELLGYNVRSAQLALQRDFARTMAGSDVGPAVFGLLVLSGANPGIAQIQIATHLTIDKASVVALVDRLEESGWVVRRRSTEDRRRHGIFLTAEGVRQLKVLKRQMKLREQTIGELFNAEERRQLISLLQRIRP
jgi:MarR family transcriptional regulator, organic hydroperoxide resistance regulator